MRVLAGGCVLNEPVSKTVLGRRGRGHKCFKKRLSALYGAAKSAEVARSQKKRRANLSSSGANQEAGKSSLCRLAFVDSIWELRRCIGWREHAP